MSAVTTKRRFRFTILFRKHVKGAKCRLETVNNSFTIIRKFNVNIIRASLKSFFLHNRLIFINTYIGWFFINTKPSFDNHVNKKHMLLHLLIYLDTYLDLAKLPIIIVPFKINFLPAKYFSTQTEKG